MMYFLKKNTRISSQNICLLLGELSILVSWGNTSEVKYMIFVQRLNTVDHEIDRKIQVDYVLYIQYFYQSHTVRTWIQCQGRSLQYVYMKYAVTLSEYFCNLKQFTPNTIFSDVVSRKQNIEKCMMYTGVETFSVNNSFK